MEGAPATISSSSTDKALFFVLGLGAGFLALRWYQKKQFGKQLQAEREKGQEEGYDEAHSNFVKVLNYVHMNNGTPKHVYDIITSEN